MEKKKVLVLIHLKIMTNILATGIMIKCMEWDFICMTILLLVKDMFILVSSIRENSMELVNWYFFKIKVIKMGMLYFKDFGKMDKKMVMEFIFTVKILPLTMKGIGKMIWKTGKEDFFLKMDNIQDYGKMIKNMVKES